MTEPIDNSVPAPEKAAPAPIIPDPPKCITITLSEPIRRGETRIDAVTLRKPTAGELRGLNLKQVLTSDVTGVLSLLPRITNPPLLQHEVDALTAEDFVEMSGAVADFFMTRAERQMMMAMVAEYQPTP